MKMKVCDTTIYKIDERVFQRGKMHSMSFTKKMQLFENLGITTVVALAPAKIDADLLSMDRKYGFIEYIYKPISDGILTADVKEDMLKLARAISKAIKNHGAKVLCHCNAGRNRSGLMNALIVRELRKCSGAEALEIVREERPRAVANIHFEEFLRSLK